MRIRALARPAARRKIGHLPEHLPRIERVIEPQSTLCGCGEMVRIGEDLRRISPNSMQSKLISAAARRSGVSLNATRAPHP